MQTVLLFVHLLIATGLVFLVLMQRSEGGALGMGGGSNALMTGRGAADVLARGTMILAGLFFVTSLTLSVLAGGHSQRKSVLEAAPTQSSQTAPSLPAPAPVRAGPLEPAADPAAPAPAAAAPAPAGSDLRTTPAAAPAASAPAAANPAVKVAPAPTTESPRASPAPAPAPTPAAASPPPLILTVPPAKPAETPTAAKPEPKPRAGPDE